MKTTMVRAAATAGSIAIAAAFAVSCSATKDATKDAMSSASSMGSSAAGAASSAASAAGTAASSAASAAGTAASSAASAAGSAATSAGSAASSVVSSVLNGTPTTLNVPGMGDVSLDGATADAYTKAGGATALGVPTAMAESVAGGTVAAFTNGTIYSSPSNGAHLVQGEILKVYAAEGGPAGTLGWPTADEAQTGGGPKVANGGWISEFQNGMITWVNQGGGKFTETVTKK